MSGCSVENFSTDLTAGSDGLARPILAYLGMMAWKSCYGLSPCFGESESIGGFKNGFAGTRSASFWLKLVKMLTRVDSWA